MKKVIGIVGEGPIDYLVLREVIDCITGEENVYRRLQPEPDMAGQFGNGWKGVWKWCESMSDGLDSFFHEITPQMDLLIVQMDADVSRKEKEVHCLCGPITCEDAEKVHPLRCEKAKDNQCPVKLPCAEHISNAEGYEKHLEALVRKWLKDDRERADVLVVVPCDSTDAWIIAAYEEHEETEEIENPWENVIARKKEFHGIRVPGKRKSISVYSKFVPRLRSQRETVAERCSSARNFEKKIRDAMN